MTTRAKVGGWACARAGAGGYGGDRTRPGHVRARGGWGTGHSCHVRWACRYRPRNECGRSFEARPWVDCPCFGSSEWRSGRAGTVNLGCLSRSALCSSARFRHCEDRTLILRHFSHSPRQATTRLAATVDSSAAKGAALWWYEVFLGRGFDVPSEQCRAKSKMKKTVVEWRQRYYMRMALGSWLAMRRKGQARDLVPRQGGSTAGVRWVPQGR